MPLSRTVVSDTGRIQQQAIFCHGFWPFIGRSARKALQKREREGKLAPCGNTGIRIDLTVLMTPTLVNPGQSALYKLDCLLPQPNCL